MSGVLGSRSRTVNVLFALPNLHHRATFTAH